MDKYLVVWPKSEDVMHINYHYTQFGECVNYLKRIFQNQIVSLDCDVENTNIQDFIKENNVKKVIMQVNYENAQNAFNMCDEIKKSHNIPVLAYGSIPIRLPNLFLNSNFDAIHTEADPEVCIKSFIRYFEPGCENEKMKDKIQGAYLIEKGKFIKTAEGMYISPHSWGISEPSEVPVDKYDQIKKKNRFVLNISRGCPYGCPHCLIQLTEGKKERRRSIPNLRESLKKIEGKYNHIKIWAANFTLDKKYVKEFCEMMSTDFPEMTWECATRIDLIKDEQLLKQMYNSGCRQISLGIESLNNQELIRTKDFKKEEVSRAIYRIQNNGIKVKGCVMLGMPNQTKESIVNTLRFLISSGVVPRPTIYTPYQEISDDLGIGDLSKYNRKTFENMNVDGVTSEQLLDLVKNPYNFERILEIKTKGERSLDEDY